MAILWKLEYYIALTIPSSETIHYLGLPFDRDLPQRRRDGAQRQELIAGHKVLWDRGERFVGLALNELF